MWLLHCRRLGDTIRYRISQFISGANMRLIELFEGNPAKKIAKAPPPRNFVAKNAQTSGAGSHASKKFTRKEKHKNKEADE
jgi:hypothetical protein